MHIPLLQQAAGSKEIEKSEPTELNSKINARKKDDDGEEVGGLILQPSKKSSTEQRHAFKAPKPRTSLLGLDKLASAKRSVLEQAKKPSVSKQTQPETSMSFDADNNESTEISFKKPLSSVSAHVRARRMETPSHPGGLSESALRTLDQRRRNPGHRGRIEANTYGRYPRRERDSYGDGIRRDYRREMIRAPDVIDLEAPVLAAIRMTKGEMTDRTCTREY